MSVSEGWSQARYKTTLPDVLFNRISSMVVQLLILHGTFSNLKPDQCLNRGNCDGKEAG